MRARMRAEFPAAHTSHIPRTWKGCGYLADPAGDHLEHDAREVDGVDGAQVVGLLELEVVEKRLHDVLAVVEGPLRTRGESTEAELCSEHKVKQVTLCPGSSRRSLADMGGIEKGRVVERAEVYAGYIMSWQSYKVPGQLADSSSIRQKTWLTYQVSDMMISAIRCRGEIDSPAAGSAALDSAPTPQASAARRVSIRSRGGWLTDELANLPKLQHGQRKCRDRGCEQY
jgi:hypothetical protein